jgi:hypothetical protein
LYAFYFANNPIKTDSNLAKHIYYILNQHLTTSQRDSVTMLNKKRRIISMQSDMYNNPPFVIRSLFYVIFFTFLSCNGQIGTKKAKRIADDNTVISNSDNDSDLGKYPAFAAPNTPGGQSPGEPFAINVVTVSSAAPVVSEYIREAGPNQSIAVTGDLFDATLSFEVSDGRNKYNAILQGRDGNRAIITIPASFKSWKTFAVRPKTATGGYGAPFLVNKTTVDWVGSDKYWVGGIVNAYGKNLSRDNGTTAAYVRLKAKSNGVLIDVIPTSVNPYRVSFVIPSLPNGIYEVWVHNGHGGDYGWSKSPNNLTVIAQLKWSAATVNGITSYGMNGNGVVDNTIALSNAIADLRGTNKTLYLPDGIYLVSNGFWLGDGKIRILGQSKEGTIIRCSNTFALSGVDAFMFSNAINDFSLEKLTINTNAKDVGNNGILRFYGGKGCGGIYLNNIKIDSRGSGYLAAPIHADVQYIISKGCDFVQSSALFHVGDNIFYENCNFYNTMDQPMAIKTMSSNVSLIGCTFQDLSSGDTEQGQGRCLVMDSGGNSRFNYYMEGNTSKNFAPRGGWWSTPKVDNNSGEQFLWEGFQTKYTGAATGGTATTINTGFTDLSPKKYCVTIIEGKGVGQTRLLKSNSNGVVTVDPWLVIPNITSKISIGVRSINSVIYKNNLQGKKVMIDLTGDEGSASCGYNAYGGVINLIVDNNTVDRTFGGLTNYAPVINLAIGIDINLFHLIKNNSLTNNKYAIRFSSATSGDAYTRTASAIQCMVYRNNSEKGTVAADVYYKFPDNNTPKIVSTIIWENSDHASPPINGVINQVVLNTPKNK